MFSTFTNSDWLVFWGIVVSTITSITAIFVSVLTLLQNSRMIEESTRPYITIAGKTTNFQEPNFYLVLKNYGSSGATITKFECNHNLSELAVRNGHTPFESVCGTFLAPGQSLITNLHKQFLFDKDKILKFDIEYKLNKRTYTEHAEIVLKTYTELIQTRASTPNKEIRNISYTLQDLVEKQL